MNAPAPLLDALERAGRVDRLDAAFSGLLLRLGDRVSPTAAALFALASAAATAGQVCVDLSLLAGTRLDGDRAWPDLPTLEGALTASGVVGRPGEQAPLVLDRGHRLYLFRYWRYESELADWLRRRAADEPAIDEAALRRGLARHFPAEAPSRPDWQRVAAAVAVMRRLCVISGGPGTGKTTTVARILALLLEQPAERPLRIALAAPTGKAAGRLQAAIAGATASLDLPKAVREGIPAEASTLHRLLGVIPGAMGFRHHRDNPLPCDLVVVDEASMIDVAMMYRLTDALAPDARLLLLGDRDQLASVEAGAVLADICSGTGRLSPAFRARVAAVTGESLPDASPGQRAPLGDAVVVLTHSYRFSEASGVGALAAAVNRGDAPGAARLVASDDCPDLSAVPDREAFAQRAVEGYRPFLEAVRDGAPPAELFDRFERFRVLCALRGGPWGVDEVNRAVEAALERAGLLRRVRGGYPGMPLMVTRNDYNLGLFNGDIGLLLPEPGGALMACFPGRGGGPYRWLRPARLENHETVFAMTVHKSQGSEYDDVLLVLPEQDAPVLTRELLYTAVTRARQGFALCAPPAILETTARRRTHRSSGLRDALLI